jgi:hypothetical protein
LFTFVNIIEKALNIQEKRNKRTILDLDSDDLVGIEKRKKRKKTF